MRLKAFTAATAADAMKLVREALGDEAIIVATEQDGAHVRVTAAIDPLDEKLPPLSPEPEPPARASAQRVDWSRMAARANGADAPARPAGRANGGDTLARVLAYHGAP